MESPDKVGDEIKTVGQAVDYIYEEEQNFKCARIVSLPNELSARRPVLLPVCLGATSNLQIKKTRVMSCYDPGESSTRP